MSTSAAQLPARRRAWTRWIGWVALVAAFSAVAFLAPWRSLVERWTAEPAATEEDPPGAHVETGSIALSPQALKTIGLKTGRAAVSDFSRTITVPAMVVERPGATSYSVSAPMTGVVTGVHIVRGEAVLSGKLLFTLRLTHEDLVQAQTEFLRSLGQLEVENRELNRLKQVASGAVAGRVLLEREYERDKLSALMNAQREALRLHGLTEQQVEWIVQERKLLREVQVFAPLLHGDDSVHHDAEHLPAPRDVAPDGAAAEETPHAHERQFVVEELAVQPGQAVNAGDKLAVLADYETLLIEGRAFEQEAEELVRAAEQNRHVAAFPEGTPGDAPLEGLELLHVANQVDLDSRALHFYVALPNQVARESTRDSGRRFITWKFKPGQRMQLRIPIETWERGIVLPVEAVAEEGAESYVFVQNGDHFDRRPVHVLRRDQHQVVVANDGSIFPGETIALTAAHQLQMALKNQGGAAVDPHAGHNH
jgi:multidrug efflux pump subunit AcrA (membrane-fusion protein)